MKTDTRQSFTPADMTGPEALDGDEDKGTFCATADLEAFFDLGQAAGHLDATQGIEAREPRVLRDVLSTWFAGDLAKLDPHAPGYRVLYGEALDTIVAGYHRARPEAVAK